jgi:hypothetical protein
MSTKPKKWTVSIPTFGHHHFEGVEAESGQDAHDAVMAKLNTDIKFEPDDEELEYGYPCHTGWPEFDATEEGPS